MADALQAVSTMEAPPAGGSYFGRHWRGEFSLPKSWWINGGLIFGLGINSVSLGAIILAVSLFQEKPILVYIVGVGELALQIAGYVWALVGIWRSAARYEGPKIWKYLAYIMSSLGIFYSLSNITQTLTLIFSV